MNDSKQFWFPAKRYGWGWGLPNCWQGWLVFIAYFVLMAICMVVLLPQGAKSAFLGYTAILSLVLVGICYAKGEPPAWRWGK
jgi:branched-subunit amino acid transport protein